MNLPARNLTLLLFGTAVTVAVLTGRYLDYVQPGMFWLLLASGVAILLLAVSGMAADVARSAAADEDLDHATHDEALPDHAGAHGHEHGHRAAWLVLPPVLLLLFCAPPALGPQTTPSAVMNAAAAEPAADTRYPPLPAGDAPRIALYDFQNRAVSDTTGSLDRDVSVTAYVAHLAGRPVLARMMIWCCVADARPIQIELAGAPALPPDGTWVTAVIRLVPGTATRERTYRPLATLVSAHVVAQPSPPYDG